jgi:hypothetical protein
LCRKGIDFEDLLAQGRDVGSLIGQTDYLDFRSLGYRGDPILYGSRFQKLPLSHQRRE